LEQKAKSIIVDLSEVTYLSSSGLRVLLFVHRETEGAGGLVLVNPRDVVKKVIDIAELDDFLTQAKTVEEAIAILEAKKKS